MLSQTAQAHFFFRCRLFFFQSELPLDPRIPGVWVGGCLGIWHRSCSMGSSAARPWGLTDTGMSVWLLPRCHWLGMSNSASCSFPPVRGQNKLLPPRSPLQVCYSGSASLSEISKLWGFVSGVEGQYTSLEKRRCLKPTVKILN